MNMTDSLVSITKASKILGVSRQTVYNLIKEGKLVPIRIDDWPYLDTEQLEKFQKERGQSLRKKPRIELIRTVLRNIIPWRR